MSKVSIIVPVFNLENYLSRCIESILKQEYFNIELILVDDGSIDNSWKIISQYSKIDKRIVPVKKNNGGAASARNEGLRRVTGEYVIFVDGDDTITNDFVSKNIKLFDIYKDLQWVSMPIIPVDINGNQIEQASGYKAFCPDNEIFVGKEEIMKALIKKKLSELCCGVIYRKSFLLGLLFNENIYYEDSYFFIDVICRTQKCATSNIGKYLYLERAGSSQKANKTYKHLNSIFICSKHKLTSYRNYALNFEDYYLRLETEYYYFFLNEKGKRTPGGNIYFDMYCNILTQKPKFKIQKFLKYFFYYYGGYLFYKKIKRFFIIVKYYI